ncbi:hypothetical protein ED733_007420 [Metarhizium rileyi]|uniref:Secreted protein n=1 Tax=Metarhizium rileyi (strain RCEF 4871) TaxID=1649241 RepID=A0A5C6GMN4_METRR|nr:hypothetical protein ED733_007420 [Metarhizium rileyi]
MHIIALASLLFFSPIYGQDLPIDTSRYKQYINETTEWIESHLRLDPDEPAVSFTNYTRAHGCPWYANNIFHSTVGDCTTAEYYIQNKMFELHNVTAFAKVEVLPRSTEFNSPTGAQISGVLGFTTSKANSVSQSNRKDWNVFGVSPIAILAHGGSHETSLSTTDTNGISLDLTHSFACPRHASCKTLVFTWYSTMRGLCQHFPMLNCNGEVPDACEYRCLNVPFKNQWCGGLLMYDRWEHRAILKTMNGWEDDDIAHLDNGYKWSVRTKQLFDEEKKVWTSKPEIPEPYLSPEMESQRPRKEE